MNGYSRGVISGVMGTPIWITSEPASSGGSGWDWLAVIGSVSAVSVTGVVPEVAVGGESGISTTRCLVLVDIASEGLISALMGTPRWITSGLSGLAEVTTSAVAKTGCKVSPTRAIVPQDLSLSIVRGNAKILLLE